MPNIKSAIKRTKTIQDRTERNNQQKSAMRTAVKKFETAAANNEENAKDLFAQAARSLDKAAAKGLIHKNAANRKKSRLLKQLNA
ncbi:30S ribosomal protein S20 [Bacillus badius]|uniref:Small ribosomal subunit protein bS20 n=1 Tax=Bacillus badius TaxID=1455 RepID=A0ABR5AZF8_BACBA|nr:30S ribosomal protein S20 [Bacillus badius]KIL75374.1 SSU ribosomal protein S20p [Bacillus badius]KIL79638.1 SSU ribosomal protein S20p [Bacillus badius]KZN98773.1 30S ribosomal protein S20 [Bacillus badius]KZR57873.1 30S ribosomal protein S20 [Bacillus badius]MED0666737.1 30S ribosomal protein S20 [Bacillus badius]